MLVSGSDEIAIYGQHSIYFAQESAEGNNLLASRDGVIYFFQQKSKSDGGAQDAFEKRRSRHGSDGNVTSCNGSFEC